ncbi:unnamed protein product [Linum tenue]|uniref:Uncharacterized protein n=2 Tax=Linum tenue TaxID=586396 RepID=A0AAV0QAL7_9ROSI|nr:unnamed protein product [Linum tenue]
MPKMASPLKRNFFPLLLFSLFVLSFFLFFSHSPSSNPAISSPIVDSSKNLGPQLAPNFSFLIKVLAYNRLQSVSRCLRSLAAADYGGDTVHLHVYVDHFVAGNDSADVLDRKLDESRQILEFVDGFVWNFGNKIVHYRTGNVGLQAQWLEAWWPSSDDEFAFIVEDDLEVAPVFYKFVRAVILNYRYNSSNFSPSIFGVTLQRPRFVPGKHGNKIVLDEGTRLFLYQIVGTWGQILFPKPWKEFRLWYDDHKVKGIKPFLDGMVTNGWYKKIGERIWTPWFIKFVHSRGYFNIYTNFGHERALSVSHRDTGVNYGKSAGPDSQLLGEKSSIDLLEMQPLSNLKWYDFCFREVLPGRIVRNVDELGPVFLQSVQKHNTVMLVSIVWASDSIARNLLCHFERLNIQNYVLVGLSSDYLFDLARRGHPVIVADELGKNMRDHKLVNSQDNILLVKAYLMKKCLEHGLNVWTVDANVLFVNDDIFHREFTDSTNDFFAGKALDLLFARSSSAAKKVVAGDGFLAKVATYINRVEPENSSNIAQVLAKLLNQNGIAVKTIAESAVGMKIDDRDSVSSEALSGKKMVYWSREMSPEFLRKRLEELSMWVVDGADSSCKAVVCHQQS